MSPRARLLIIDDDDDETFSIARHIAASHRLVAERASFEEALRTLGRSAPSVVLVKACAAREDWRHTLRALDNAAPGVPCVLAAENATASDVAAMLREGAFDFVAKPVRTEELDRVIMNAVEAAERNTAKIPAIHAHKFPIVAESRVMQDVTGLLAKAAQGTATVLLRGESGTGKELAARAIHDLGPRSNGPFVKIDCTALPAHLVESELFGHERGAFTGALARKLGRVELAEGGTLLLDEIGELDAPLQAKLLRLLQDRAFERVGGMETVRVDIRIVAATHRPLEQMVEAGEFREDLFYRLNVVPIWLPPLRARRDDIAPLATLFCKVFGERNGRPNVTIDDSALRVLRRERWPGNVRQLQNMIERLVVLGDVPTISEVDVVAELSRGGAPFATEPVETSEPGEQVTTQLEADVLLAERSALVRALDRASGNRSHAARLLGVSRSTLYAKMQEHGIRGD